MKYFSVHQNSVRRNSDQEPAFSPCSSIAILRPQTPAGRHQHSTHLSTEISRRNFWPHYFKFSSEHKFTVHTVWASFMAIAFSMYSRSSALMRGCWAGESYTRKSHISEQNVPNPPIHNAIQFFFIQTFMTLSGWNCLQILQEAQLPLRNRASAMYFFVAKLLSTAVMTYGCV